MTDPPYRGVDVAKAYVDLAARAAGGAPAPPDAPLGRYATDAAGLAALAAACRGAALVVLEPTGGYEALVGAALAAVEAWAYAVDRSRAMSATGGRRRSHGQARPAASVSAVRSGSRSTTRRASRSTRMVP